MRMIQIFRLMIRVISCSIIYLRIVSINMYDEDGHYAASLTKRALSLGVTMSTLLLALKLLGLSNAWNVAGWVILGTVAAITVGVVGYKIYKSSKSKKTKKTAKKWKRKGE